MGKYMYIYGVLMCLAAHKYTIKSGGVPERHRSPPPGGCVEGTKGAREKEKDRAEPSLLWAGDTAYTYILLLLKGKNPAGKPIYY